MSTDLPTVVLLHGNPETPVVWDPLRAALARTDSANRTVVTPHLPGFGSPIPTGFDASKEAYAQWLTSELEAIVERSGPVDVVGHDWGGVLAMRVISQRPELVRSWACDVLELFHADYVWHDFAQIWQKSPAGEDYFAGTLATAADIRIAMYENIGIPIETGTLLVAAADQLMCDCVLRLYRSAIQPAMAVWGEAIDGAGTRPGLCITAENDPFVRNHDMALHVGTRLGASAKQMAGQGHWWMLGDPDGAAAMLRTFWAGL